MSFELFSLTFELLEDFKKSNVANCSANFFTFFLLVGEVIIQNFEIFVPEIELEVSQFHMLCCQPVESWFIIARQGGGVVSVVCSFDTFSAKGKEYQGV